RNFDTNFFKFALTGIACGPCRTSASHRVDDEPGFRQSITKKTFMKLLLSYLGRHKGLIFLALLLAAVNQVFSLLNPYILGNLIIDPYANRAADFRTQGADTAFFRGITIGLLMIIGVAMVSRIAKAFQDYVV